MEDAGLQGQLTRGATRAETSDKRLLAFRKTNSIKKGSDMEAQVHRDDIPVCFYGCNHTHTLGFNLLRAYMGIVQPQLLKHTPTCTRTQSRIQRG